MAIIKSKDVVEVNQITKDLKKVRDEIDALTASNKKLSESLQTVKKSNDGTEAKKLAEGTDKLKKSTQELTGAQKNEIKILKQLEKAEQDLINSQTSEALELEKLKQAKRDQTKLNKDIVKELSEIEKGYVKNTKSINNLRKANKKLTEERNKLNLETEEGRKKLKKLNDQLDENNKAIKENTDSLTKQKIGIGGYSESIKEALPGMAGMVAGFKQMTIAALKFIATPIGAVLAVIVAAFKLLQGAFSRSLSSQEKLTKITGKLSAALGVVLDALIPVVEFILDQVLIAFESMGKAAVFVIEKLEKWGIISEETSKKVIDSFDKSADAADRLAQAERDLANADINLQKLQLRFQTLAERQRQIRDDESLSIEQRIEANKELGRILAQQTQAELVQAARVLQIAKDRQTVNGESVESINEIGFAEIKLLEITERVEAQKSEQLVNTNSLLREQSELYLKIAEEREKDLIAEIETTKLKQETEEERKNKLISDQNEITASFVANQEEQAQAAAEANDKFLQQAAIITDVAQTAGAELGRLMAEGQLTFKEFGKLLLKTTLDLIQRQVNIYLAALLAREVGTKGAIGLGTFAILSLAINTALGAAKSAVSNFNEGTEYVPGTGNKDTVPAMLTPGERVVPAEINQMLHGIPNSELPGLMNKQDNNIMIAGLLMNMNDTNNQMLTALLNGGYSYTEKGVTYLTRADGTKNNFTA